MRHAGLAVAVVGIGIAGVAAAGGVGMASPNDSEEPITGEALARASAAALAETGGGTVTQTEFGDEESLYQVEVTLADGSQVDVQLDDAFNVVGSKTEAPGTDDAPGAPDSDGDGS